jgi:hypothetical protein
MALDAATITVKERPPLALSVAVTAPNGSRVINWHPLEDDPLLRPTAIQLKTARFFGFVSASLVLQRPIIRNYADLALLGDLRFTGLDGRSAWEGRLSARPSTTEGGHSFAVSAVGWMSATRRQKFSMLFIDRALAGWVGPSAARRAVLVGLGYNPNDPSTLMDLAGGAGVDTGWDEAGGWTATTMPITEALYDAGPDTFIARVLGSHANNPHVGTAAPWVKAVITSAGDSVSGGTTSVITGSASGSFDHGAAPGERFATLQLAYNDAGGADGSDRRFETLWTDLRVIGNHGLALHGTAPNEGVKVCEVVRWIIDTQTPLSSAGVADCDAILQQLAFIDRVWPYDALLTCNQATHWGIDCWEDRTVHFSAPTEDYQWRVRRSGPGAAKITYQGQSIEDLVTGLDVEYVDSSTGRRTILRAENYGALRDTKSSNPYVAAGETRVDTLTLSESMTASQALAAGAGEVATRTQPKAPGLITVDGWVEDKSGHLHPAWMMRSGQRVLVVDDPDEVPRMISDTTYDHDLRVNRLSMDGATTSPDSALA